MRSTPNTFYVQPLSYRSVLPSFSALTGVNFINILSAHFSYKSKLSSFSLVTFGFVIFGANFLQENHRRKTLMKLTTALTVGEKSAFKMLVKLMKCLA